MKQQNVITWVLKLVATVIMLQTLYFKFTAAPESVYIFTTLGIEPFGRIGIGVLELIASIAILIPATTSLGALLGIGLMSGAIFAHITQLGIVVQGDGGQLFAYALIVLVSCLLLLLLLKKQVFSYINLVKSIFVSNTAK